MMLLLYRYMNRTGAHPSLRMDPDLRDFLTLDADLPKSSGTSALSAAGVMRLFGRMGDAVTKLSSHIAETDQVYIICLRLISRTSLYWVGNAIFSYGLVYISSICCSVQAWSFRLFMNSLYNFQFVQISGLSTWFWIIRRNALCMLTFNVVYDNEGREGGFIVHCSPPLMNL